MDEYTINDILDDFRKKLSKYYFSDFNLYIEMNSYLYDFICRKSETKNKTILGVPVKVTNGLKYDYIIWGVSVFDDRETFLASGFNKNEDE